MKRVLKWAGWSAAGVVALVMIAVVAMYAKTEWLRAKSWDVPDQALALQATAVAGASAQEGKRLATVLGCFNGCHGERADGGVFIDIPNVARLVAPSLTHLASQVDDADLIRSIRFGVKRDDTSVWGMPSQSFYHLTDRQLASIIAFLRREPASPPVEESSSFRILARVGMALGQYRPAAETTTAAPVRLDPADAADEHALGRQLAVIACSECHGADLQGNAQFPSPALGIVRGYSRDTFETLMRKGKAIGDREVGLMSVVARNRFSALTESETDALYDYLSSTGGLDRVGAGPDA